MRIIIPMSRQTQLVFSGMNGHTSFLSAHFDQEKNLIHMSIYPRWLYLDSLKVTERQKSYSKEDKEWVESYSP